MSTHPKSADDYGRAGYGGSERTYVGQQMREIILAAAHQNWTPERIAEHWSLPLRAVHRVLGIGLGRGVTRHDLTELLVAAAREVGIERLETPAEAPPAFAPVLEAVARLARAYDHPETMMDSPTDPTERLWRKVTKLGLEEGSHWVWCGTLTATGYPVTPWNGRTAMAARVLWDLTQPEPVPLHTRMRNRCGKRLCVNPDHYELGGRLGDELRKIDAWIDLPASRLSPPIVVWCPNGHRLTLAEPPRPGQRIICPKCEKNLTC